MGDWRDAVHCRNRAELLRKIADETPDENCKLALRNVAEYYGKLAASLEHELRNALVAA